MTSLGRAPGTPGFAHASEAELARILDFYGIAWEYESHVFPILWNLDGKVVESFTPDFHLPELDLYLELTTLRQSLVRRKNRKLRRLRELYPGIRIKLFYARDFRALMLKYGRVGLLDSLSGTEGQVTPPREPTEGNAGRTRRPDRPEDGGQASGERDWPAETAAEHTDGATNAGATKRRRERGNHRRRSARDPENSHAEWTVSG